MACVCVLLCSALCHARLTTGDHPCPCVWVPDDAIAESLETGDVVLFSRNPAYMRVCGVCCVGLPRLLCDAVVRYCAGIAMWRPCLHCHKVSERVHVRPLWCDCHESWNSTRAGTNILWSQGVAGLNVWLCVCAMEPTHSHCPGTDGPQLRSFEQRVLWSKAKEIVVRPAGLQVCAQCHACHCLGASSTR